MQRRSITKAVTKVEDEPLELPLHLKYRPVKLSEVIGQDEVVRALKSLIKSGTRPHSYLFVGPSGCGKTTLARILGSEFNCDPNNILEADAATNNGIEAMRGITSTLQYHGFGDSPNRLIVIDECHALSKAAWQSLLKTVEEPPEHVYIVFCTTESGKVPETIVTRCQSFTLKPVKFDPMMDLLEFVAEEEQLKVADKILQLVAKAASGSPRQALTMLASVCDCEDVEEAAAVLESPLDKKEVIDLCRLLVSGKLRWPELVDILKAIPDMNPESVRIIIVNYLAACLMGAKSEQAAGRLLDMLAPFSKPFNASDKSAPLLLAFGDVILA